MIRKMIVIFLFLTLLLPCAISEGEQEGVTILITAVGDCTLGGVANHTASSEKLFEQSVRKHGMEWFLSDVKGLFEQDDFTIINLEGPLTTTTEYEETAKFYFRGKPEYTGILTCSSVDVANVANNHSHNFRDEGFNETISALNDAGIGVCGYENEYYAEVKGITVGFLGFDQWRSTDAQMKEQTEAAREKCDLLIVSFHGGIENSYSMSEQVEHAGELLIKAGADLVIGNHSHVYGGMRLYKGKYITGSLGNFCFGGNTNPKDFNCIVFRQAFTVYPDGRVEDAGIDIIPAQVGSKKRTNDCHPTLLEDGYNATSLFNGVLQRSNFKAKNVKWLSDSYAVRNGLNR